jgi:signal transduction histidine kinase
MHVLVSEVMDLIATDLRQARIDYRIEISEALPRVSVDVIQVQQVVLNLLRNALEAMNRPTCEDRRLTIGGRQQDASCVEVFVVDSGPGCPPEELPKVFDAFFTTKEAGIGMGLSISRSIIEAQGGRLWVTQNPDHGLTFHFTVPAAKEG